MKLIKIPSYKADSGDFRKLTSSVIKRIYRNSQLKEFLKKIREELKGTKHAIAFNRYFYGLEE